MGIDNIETLKGDVMTESTEPTTPPVERTSYITPDLANVPEDDQAEPANADVDHHAPVDVESGE